MTMQFGGLLTLWLHLDPKYEEAMDAWYNYEHTDIVLSVPGVLGSRRFKSVEPYSPDQLRYLVFYEMADEHVQTSAAFQAIVDTPTPWSRYLRTLYQMRRRTNYRCLVGHETQPVEHEAAIVLVRSSLDSAEPKSGHTNLLADFLQQPLARAAQLLQAAPNQYRIVDGAKPSEQAEVLELYSFTRYERNIIDQWVLSRRQRVQQSKLHITELSCNIFVPTITPRRKRV